MARLTQCHQVAGVQPQVRPKGHALPVVYLWWASVVLAMYPLCVWFGRLKQRRSDAWLRYF